MVASTFILGRPDPQSQDLRPVKPRVTPSLFSTIQQLLTTGGLEFHHEIMSANGRKRNNMALDSRPRIRRGRKTTSCSQCHARKQKCNRELPCSRCIQRGVPQLCQWPENEKGHAMSPERVSAAGIGYPRYQNVDHG